MKRRIAFISLVLLLTASCGQQKTQEEQILRVKTARATLVQDGQRKEFPFIAKPFRTSELSFRVSGPIDHFEAYAGNHFRRNDIIAEIDPRDFRLKLENSEAVYRRAEADFNRIESLYNKDNVPASAYENARAAYIGAKVAYNSALNDYGDTKLRAPFDGYIGETFIEKFQEVRAGQPVITLVDISKLRIEVYVTQDIAMRARDLENISLLFDYRPYQVFNAKVTDCARSTTSNNLSYLLTALLDNKGGALPSGISGKVFFELPGSTSGEIAVPQSAVCHRPEDGDFVWKIEGTTVSKCPVTLGELLPDGRIVIRSGLSQEDTIAASGLRFLSDGMKVETEDAPKVQPVANVSR